MFAAELFAPHCIKAGLLGELTKTLLILKHGPRDKRPASGCLDTMQSYPDSPVTGSPSEKSQQNNDTLPRRVSRQQSNRSLATMGSAPRRPLPPIPRGPRALRNNSQPTVSAPPSYVSSQNEHMALAARRHSETPLSHSRQDAILNEEPRPPTLSLIHI